MKIEELHIQHFIIRKARVCNLRDIMRIEVEVFGQDRFDEGYMTDLIKGKFNSAVFIAKVDERTVGYATAAVTGVKDALYYNEEPILKAGIRLRKGEPVGVLKSLAVENNPNFRRKGIGTKLVKVRLQWLHEMCVEHVFVHAIPKGGFHYLAEKLKFNLIPGWEGKTYSNGSVSRLYYRKISGAPT